MEDYFYIPGERPQAVLPRISWCTPLGHRHVRTMYIWGSAWTERSNKSKKETQIIEQTIFKREERWTSKHTYACVFLPLHNSTLPFPAYNGPKVLLSVDSASIHIYSGLTHQCKRIPVLHLASYGYLFPSQYVAFASIAPSKHTRRTYSLQWKSKGKRDGDVQALSSSLPLTQRTRTQNATKTTPTERGAHRSSTVPTTTATVELVLRVWGPPPP